MSNRAKEQNQARTSLKAIVSSLLHLGAQGLAIRGREHDEGNFMALLRLRAQDVPDFANWLERPKSWTSWEIQNEILRLAAKLISKKHV